MIDWSRPFTTPGHPARPYLLQKGVYLLLAFDAWLTMLPHGARYGMGGFNVTHFAWLDAWASVPSAAFYVGLMSLIGCLALIHLLAGGGRWLRGTITALYTLSWTISLFDSYQHHYLLSWILLWTVFMPDVRPDNAQRGDADHVRGFGVPMTAITCGIVYGFTAIAKSEADWRAGHVLRRLSNSKVPGHLDPGVLDPLRDLLMSTTVSEQTAWALIAHSMIALQIVTALGYLAASERDAGGSGLRRIACAFALCAALSFHVFAEVGGMFNIGWFSYYMLWIACALLAPSAWAVALARLISWPGRKLTRLVAAAGGKPRRVSALLYLPIAAAALCTVGGLVDLPGAFISSVLTAALLLAWGLLMLRADNVSSGQGLALAGALTAASYFVVITQTDVRFDYYRRGAGELRALGELEQALAMYRKADRYAGPERSRTKQIRQLKQMIRATSRDSD